MGQINKPAHVKLFCGIIAPKEHVIKKINEELTALFGPIDTESEIMPFNFTTYYEGVMGGNLLRIFVSFANLVDPANLALIKIQTNEIEDKLSSNVEKRCANIDPGYVTAAKLVLATTKNFAHRIYIGQGIYAEITLNFKKDGLKSFEWTYPDYKSGKYDAFFIKIRQHYMAQQEKNSQ